MAEHEGREHNEGAAPTPQRDHVTTDTPPLPERLERVPELGPHHETQAVRSWVRRNLWWILLLAAAGGYGIHKFRANRENASFDHTRQEEFDALYQSSVVEAPVRQLPLTGTVTIVENALDVQLTDSQFIIDQCRVPNTSESIRHKFKDKKVSNVHEMGNGVKQGDLELTFEEHGKKITYRVTGIFGRMTPGGEALQDTWNRIAEFIE